jgi:hypothetical protein
MYIMKKNYLKAALVVAFAGVLLVGCGGSKKVPKGDPIDEEIAQIRKQMELEDLKAQAQQKGKMIEGEQRMILYCKEEGFDKPGEYLAGLGVVNGRPDANRAIIDANRAAVANIASKFVGVLQNAVEDYSKDATVPSGKKIYESSVEGGTKAIGEKAINKLAAEVCREVTRSATGAWSGYVAMHVSLKDAMDEVASEMEVLKVDYDKKKFFDSMKEGLAEQAKRQKEAIGER